MRDISELISKRLKDKSAMLSEKQDRRSRYKSHNNNVTLDVVELPNFV